MNDFFAALREEFSVRLREEAREKIGQFVYTTVTLVVMGMVLAVSVGIGILLR